MSRKRWLLVGAGAALVVLFMITSNSVTRGSRGAASPEAAVTGYVAALAADDKEKLARLADPDPRNADEITERLRKFGAGKLTVSDTSFQKTESDHMVRATITGTVAGRAVKDTLWLRRHGDRWFLSLGPGKEGHPRIISST